jgi:hypothetical protein
MRHVLAPLLAGAALGSPAAAFAGNPVAFSVTGCP